MIFGLAQFARKASGHFGPPRNGYLKMEGLKGAVEILTDRHGVPHLTAGDRLDLYFAQGYIHARERLFQLDLNRRVGEGRLSEVFGPASLAADRFCRTIGLARCAKAHWEVLDVETRSYLEAYANGINAGMAGQHPPETLLLKIRPEAWQPWHTLLWSKVMAFDMGSNWEAELVRAELMQKLGPEAALKFHQSYLPECPLTVASPLDSPAGVPYEQLRALYQEAVPWMSLAFGRFPGSNAWAVSGDRSATGTPLLSNDPHLIIRLPSVWFEMHLECPEVNVYGVTLPGAPGVIIGHNEHVAWGITNSYVDTQDLIIEEISQEACRRENGTAPLRKVVETIRIKGKPAHEETVFLSDNGPLICRGETHGIALRWLGYEYTTDTSTQAIFQLNGARDATEVKAALKNWISPCLNFVYADSRNIGYQLAGAVPRRREGLGLYPVPGWESRFNWDGPIPFEEMPRVENPECGYVVSANNAIVAHDFPHFLSVEWMGGYRAQRIGDLLAASKEHTLEDFQRYHLDTYCIPGQKIQKLVQSHLLAAEWTAPAAAAYKVFQEWNGHLGADSAGGCVYQFFLLQVCRQAFLPVLGESLFPYWMGQAGNPLALMGPYGGRYTGFLVHALESGSEEFLPPGATWAEILRRTFELVAADLTRLQGSDPTRWRWGVAHTFQLQHPLGAVKALAPFFNGEEVEFVGDTDTICQSAVLPHRPYKADCWAPSWRFCLDLGDISGSSRSVLPSGQSGWPGDEHYLSQWDMWRIGQMHPSFFARGDLERSRPERLSLLPD